MAGQSSKVADEEMQEFCLVGTFLRFALVFAALPKIPIIGKKVLMRTNQFFDCHGAFSEKTKTPACFHCLWGTKKKLEAAAEPPQAHFVVTSVTPLHLREGKKTNLGVTLQEKTCKNMWRSILNTRWAIFILFFYHNASLLSFLHLNLMILWGGTKHNPQIQFCPQVKLFPREIS